MGAETTGDEERAAFDKDGEGADGDGREGHGRAAQIIDDDVDFQCFRYPAKKEQPDLPQKSQLPSKEPLALYEHKRRSPEFQEPHTRECRGHSLTG